MNLDAYLRVRPRLYHLTAAANLDRIRRTGRLEPAASLFKRAGRPELLHRRRRAHAPVSIDGELVHIRDQAPLFEKNMALDGMSFDEFVAHVNAHVFFWPGKEDGPIDYGQRHFARYAGEECVVLVLDARRVFESNPHPKFCRFNSGSPRWSGGVASPRGRTTFVPAHEFEHGPGRVVETVFDGPITLPDGAWEVRSHRDLIRGRAE